MGVLVLLYAEAKEDVDGSPKFGRHWKRATLCIKTADGAVKMRAPSLLPAAPAPAPPAVAAPCSDLAFASWFMPLPPPPVGGPGGASASARPTLQVSPRHFASPDPDSTLAGHGGSGAAASEEFVPDSQPGASAPGLALAGSGHGAVAASSPRIQVRAGAGINCGVAGQLASSSLSASGVPSMTGAGREAEVTGGWHIVTSRNGPRRPALAAPAFKPAPIPRWLQGRCCRCLHRGHRAESCRDPIRCSRCLQNGHKSRGCKNNWKPLSSLDSLRVPPPPLPRPSASLANRVAPPRLGRGWETSAQRPLLQSNATAAVMQRMGDAALRPEEDFVVVPATPEMQAEAAILASNCAVAWLEGARQDIPCHQVAAELATALGARPADVEVVKHYPEQFLVRFMHQHHCAEAVSRGDLRGNGHRIFVREWRLEAHADNEDQLHHVRLCLEGVPLHGWNHYIATFLIGRGCSLDYIEPRSLRKEDTRDMALWAWTSNPSAIPKVKWLTLSACGHRRRGRRGLRHRVLIHLDLHEDHSKAGDDDDNPPPPDVHEFTWYRKKVDGTYTPRERGPTQGCAERRGGRREDEGDRDGRRGRDDGRAREGWGARVRRSLSRNARDRHQGEVQNRSRDRSGGRRHAGNSLAASPAPMEGACCCSGSQGLGLGQ
ncbi:uncharacterized protein LOC119268500 [Triticum dicoccoides]|uniref:uncharacterized protein LOC119268500 n=1 Tax=Triticum dicoccoides TaxID=85692 RepID=UPI00189053A9|nr:uncharacterized protein LOC119268500 [Triticum dicoccoides]